MALHEKQDGYEDCGNGTQGKIDLVFVLDDSSSVGPSRFQLMREFASNITNSLDIGLQKSLVGVMAFSNTPVIYFGVTAHTDKTSVVDAISKIPYRTGHTYTNAALDLLRTEGQPGGRLNLRNGVSHIVILVTDGESSLPSATITSARTFHAIGIYDQVYALGVGRADMDELKAIADNNSRAIFTRNFDRSTFQALEKNITQQLTPCIGSVIGDPHFIVPLQSNDIICYSIQGHPGLAFNLIYNKDYAINALFIDSINDEKEATWIGKLAVIPRPANKSKAVIFDSVKQQVVLVNQGQFRASVVDKISYDESGKISVKFTKGIAKQAGNPTVHVKYGKPLASFDVTFYNNHLDVNWDIKYDSVSKIHGLMGQFMVKGMAVDHIKKILIYPDGRDPVPVEKDNVMTGRTCWKALNPGYQGEGLIKGSVLDYMVSNLLENDFKFKDLI